MRTYESQGNEKKIEDYTFPWSMGEEKKNDSERWNKSKKPLFCLFFSLGVSPTDLGRAKGFPSKSKRISACQLLAWKSNKPILLLPYTPSDSISIRNSRIRTCDLHHPKMARYQTAPYSVIYVHIYIYVCIALHASASTLLISLIIYLLNWYSIC